MAHYGTLKDTRIGDAAEDIRGSHLYGLNDEKLGKIDDVIFRPFHGKHPLCRCGYRRLAFQQEIHRARGWPARLYKA